MHITVVIPSYNGAAFIAEALGSALAQDAPVAEVVVVDDASTDATAEIVGRVGVSDSRVRLVRLPENSGGPARPLNVGVAASRTELIALLDHDDVMAEGKLRRQRDCLEASPGAGFAFCDYVYVRESLEQRGMSESDLRLLKERSTAKAGGLIVPSEFATEFQVAAPGGIQSCSSLMFRKSVWEEVGRFDPGDSVICDYKFKLAVSARYDLAFVPCALFRKRLHADNLFTRRYSATLVRSIASVGLEHLRKSCPRGFTEPALAERFRQELLDGVHSSRTDGEYLASLWFFAQYLRLFGLDARIGGRALKWPAGAVRDLIRRGAGCSKVPA